MQNELILLGSLVFIFSSIIFLYRFFGKSGLYAMTVIASVVANIECMILINAFGIEQTLGNVFFASTFLITDILSENYGKKAADKAVWLGIFTSAFFIIISQSWMMYIPSQADWVMPSIKSVFSNTPRIMLSSFTVYAVSQFIDVRLYHLWWNITYKRFGDKKKFLWLRNNGSTLISQLINTVLFTIMAFGGVYDTPTLINIMLSSYVIFVVAALCDTPVLYIARKIKEKKEISE